MEHDLKDLVEIPRETLEVELKEWVDLQEPVIRAKIARHLAAMANHGGGYLVFGFKDNLSQDQNRPSSLKKYNQDTFSAIIKRYLTPPFQCQALIETNKNGEKFPIVRVPSHGRVPIVAKADGPKDGRGRAQGITAGTYYIRKPGPESAPIVSAKDWDPLIRRCTLNDRDKLLGDIAGLVQSPKVRRASTRERLTSWHQAGRERFLQLLASAKGFRWPVPFENNHYQLSYLISAYDSESLSENSLRQILEEVNNEARNTVWTGWSMFYPFGSPEIAPTVHAEQDDGTGTDVLEANLIGGRDYRTSLPDFWRFAPNGRATLVRAYREDRENTTSGRGLTPGKWLCPETVLRETAELVTHSRLVARRFQSATEVNFRCTWVGLKNRELDDFTPAIYWGYDHIAKADQRTVEGEWTTAELTAGWPTIVAELSCPILRLFGFTSCGPDLVERIAARFVKL